MGQRGHISLLFAIQRVLRKPSSHQGAFVNVTRSFNNRLGLRVRENVVEEVFGSLNITIALVESSLQTPNKEGLDSHLGKHRLLIRVLKLPGESFGHDH